MIRVDNRHWGKDHSTAGLPFNKTGFDQKENMLLFECCNAAKSKLVKLETSQTGILPATVSALCNRFVQVPCSRENTPICFCL